MSAHWLISMFALVASAWYHLSWEIAIYRLQLVIIVVLVGIALAVYSLRRSPGPKRKWGTYVLRSLIASLTGLTFTSALVAVSVITHAADARWLPPNQRSAPRIPTPKVPSAPNLPFIGNALGSLSGAINSGLESLVSHTNTALSPVLNLEVQVRAIWVATHIILEYGMVSAVAGTLLAIALAVGYVRERREARSERDDLYDRIEDTERRLHELERRMGVKPQPLAETQPIPGTTRRLPVGPRETIRRCVHASSPGPAWYPSL